MDKKQAREKGRIARQSIAEADRAVLDRQLFEQALKYLQGCRTIGCYVSLKEEAGTVMIIDWCLKQSIRVALPAIAGNQMRFRELHKQEDLVPGQLGIMEPAEGTVVQAEEMDLIFVPLTAFDKEGNRTGFGKGFYDRYLNGCRNKIGLAYACQEMDHIETDAGDVRLDMILTPAQQFHVYPKNDL